jgi:hypothetical protein
VIKRLVARIQCVRPEFQESGSWYLLHDNAPAHSSGTDSEFSAKGGIPVLSHQPYSPDLATDDFFLPKLNIAIKGTRFKAVSSIQHTVKRELKAIREEAFSRAFDSLYERCKPRAVASGRAGTVLSDGINKYSLLFLCVFLWPQFGNLNKTLYITCNAIFLN